MKILVLGAGIIGISTAWHLLERGHDVTVVDRQPDAALETSFANAAQISVSYCEPWANRHAPAKLLKWMFRNDAPLLFRPQLDWQQWRWGLQFLAQCNDAAFERNVQPAGGAGRLQPRGAEGRGARHRHRVPPAASAASRTTTPTRPSFDGAAHAARADAAATAWTARWSAARSCCAIEPAFRPFADRIVGGTYTASDESGDARVFTQQLAARCAARGAQFLFGHDVERLETAGGAIDAVRVRDRATGVAAAPEGRRRGGGLRLLQRAAAAPGGRGPADLPRQGLQRHLQLSGPSRAHASAPSTTR